MWKEHCFFVLQDKKLSLPSDPAPVIASCSAFIDDAVAGNNQVDRIFGAGCSNGATGLRMSAFSGQFLIADCAAIGNCCQSVPYFFLKISAL